jgi:hypothetical protein
VVEGAWRRRLGFRQERQDAHVTVDVWIIFYVGSGLELKHMEKGKIVLPWDDFFAPARRACGWRFLIGAAKVCGRRFTGVDKVLSAHVHSKNPLVKSNCGV